MPLTSEGISIRTIDRKKLEKGDVLAKINDGTTQGKLIVLGSRLGGQAGNLQHIAIFVSQDDNGTVIDAHKEPGVSERSNFFTTDMDKSENLWLCFRLSVFARSANLNVDKFVERARSMIGEQYGGRGMAKAVLAPFRWVVTPLMPESRSAPLEEEVNLLTETDQSPHHHATFCSEFASYALWNIPRLQSLCMTPNGVVRRMTGQTDWQKYAAEDYDDSEDDFGCMGIVL